MKTEIENQIINMFCKKHPNVSRLEPGWMLHSTNGKLFGIAPDDFRDEQMKWVRRNIFIEGPMIFLGFNNNLHGSYYCKILYNKNNIGHISIGFLEIQIQMSHLKILTGTDKEIKIIVAGWNK